MSEKKFTVASIGPKIDACLDPLLRVAGFNLQHEIVAGHTPNAEFENPEVVVKFSGPDVDLLLGNRAELLLALEHVVMESMRLPLEDHSRLSFDANDYRLLRIEELRVSAAAAAEKVKRTGVPFRFNPMNSRERRVIHLALRAETTLRSESSGVGSHRHVVIYPVGMASLPDPPPPPFRPPGDRFGSRPSGGPPRGDRPRTPGRGRR